MDSEQIEAILADMRSVKAADVSVSYIEKGDGEPVVLLHGYPESPLTYRHQIETLSRSHRVIAPQWPGWGSSARDLRVIPEYNLEVDRLARFLDELGLRKVNLVAHDYGGLLSLGFAIRHPERVTRYALLNCRSHRTFPLNSYVQFLAFGIMARSARLRPLFQWLPIGAVHRRAMRKYVRMGCFSEAILEHYIGWMDTRAGREWFGHFFRYYELSPRLEFVAGIERIRCPTTIIWGDRDPYNPYRIAIELQRLIPNAQLVRIAGADHYVMEERPREVSDALLGLLDRAERKVP